ncbi:MAG: hypothetical protein ACI38A_10570 [Candidatus Ornithomonoglobus sp.]
MKKEDINSTRLVLFASTYLKSGRNAAAAGRAIGVSRQRANQLKKEPEVQEIIKQLEEMLSIDKLAAPDKEELGKEIADINDIMKVFTNRLYRREEDEIPIVVKSGTAKEFHEEVQIVKKKCSIADSNKAASELAKILINIKNNESGSSEGGVILMPQIAEE